MAKMRRFLPILSTLTCAILSSATGNPAWHLDVLNLLVNERLDPIVDPNAVGGHMHDIVGGSNFGASYNYENQVSDRASLGTPISKLTGSNLDCIVMHYIRGHS